MKGTGHRYINGTYRDNRYITCGRSESAVGMVSVASDFGSQPMTTQGRRRSDRYRFKSVAVTADCDRGDVIPSESGKDSRREVTEDNVENSCGRPVRSIILAPVTDWEDDVEGIPATMRCNRGSAAHLNTIETSVRISPRSRVPIRVGSLSALAFADVVAAGLVRALCRSSRIDRDSIAVSSCKDSSDASSAGRAWSRSAR